MFDLILRYGTVVTPHGTSQQDVAISGETISAITSPGTIDDTQAKRVIDVNGKIVMPGGIDPHVHCKWIMPMPDGPLDLQKAPRLLAERHCMAERQHLLILQPA